MRRLFVLAVLAACTQSSPGSLVATVAEPPGGNCAAGGEAIQIGVDDDGDGELDAGEVTSTAYVCKDATPPRQLVTTTVEPAGAHCANGGQAIQIGADTDSDGVLDASEVTTTSYVCGGPAGTTTLVALYPEPVGPNCPYGGQLVVFGPDLNDNHVLDAGEGTSSSYVCTPSGGLQPLLRVDVEPSGTHCSSGGSAVHVGIDVDADGLLQDDEIQATTYLCGAPPRPTVIYGDVMIHNSYDAAQLDGVAEITGNLECETHSSSWPMSLPTLQHVGGAVRCSTQGPVLLPQLVTAESVEVTAGMVDLSSLVGGYVRSEGSLSELSLPSFRTGTVWVDGAALSSVSLPVFESGEFRILADGQASQNAPLSVLALPSFTSGTVVIYKASFTTLSLPLLATGGVAISSVPVLTTLDLPAMSTGSLAVGDAASLTSITAASLVEGSIDLRGNASLAAFTAPNLVTATGLSIVDNPHFPTCRAQLLATQTHATTVSISGNDDTATCP